MKEKDLNIKQLKEDLNDLKKYIEDFWFFLPIPACSVNPLGIIMDANNAFYQITGYKKGEEINGETVFRIENLFEDREKWKALEKKILKKEFIKRKEAIILTKEKEKIPVNLSASWREDERKSLIGYFLAFIDISETKKLQEGLESEVEKRTIELKKRVEELERFHRLTVGRELKMIKLKEEIERLKNKQ